MHKHARRVLSFTSCKTLHTSSEVPLLPIVGIPGRRGLPVCPLLRIQQVWPQVDGCHLLTCLCGQLLPHCGYVWLLQLGNPDPLWLCVVIIALYFWYSADPLWLCVDIIYAKIFNSRIATAQGSASCLFCCYATRG